MSDWVETTQPCPCGKSSDAYAVNGDGWGTCFSCGDRHGPDGESQGAAAGLETGAHFKTLKKRGITAATCMKFGYGIIDGKQVAPYFDAKGRMVAQKVRGRNKDFYCNGDLSSAALFGMNIARPGGKMIVVTEGEIDAMSINQSMGGTWPAVSVKSGAQSALSDLKGNLEFLEGYDTIVLAFDDDGPGQAATDACVELFTPGKCKIMSYGACKDANEMMIVSGESAVRNAVWDAKEFRPDGVVNLADLREKMAEPMKMGVQYPWPGLNRKLFGSRPQELITWTAGTGVGKTAVVSELVHHLITSGHKVGIIYLEEGIIRAGRRIIGIELNKPIHLPGIEVSTSDFNEAFDRCMGGGNLVAYDHFGSLDEEVLANRMRFMVKSLGCDTVVLDHISMVVSGASLDADERRMLDHAMTTMRSMTQETRATFHVVSHLRRGQGRAHEEGGQVSLSHLRGTQAIAQLSDAVIALERNQQADDPDERNTTVLRVLKNRYAGLTGPAATLRYNHETGRLIDVTNTERDDGDADGWRSDEDF
jgi:twinkle protein